MENSKRILVVVTQGDWGGVQQYLVRFAIEARKRGYIVCIATGNPDELGRRAGETGIEIHELKEMKRNLSLLRDILAVREIRAFIREWKPDVVYLHSSKAGFVGSIAAHREDVNRIVYRIGGWSFLDPVSPSEQWMRKLTEKMAAGLKDVIVTVHPGDEALAKIIGIKPREKIVTIPNGLDLVAFDRALIAPLDAKEELRKLWNTDTISRSIGPNDTARFIITVANFYKTKNLDGYLDAIARINEPGLKFLIVGDGDERKTLEEKRKTLGLEDRVSLPGKRNDVANLLRGADAFVLPSVKEGMPWTILEAMAASLPIITTDVGACAWMLNQGGTIVPPNNPDALAAAIQTVFSDYGKARMQGVLARRQVEQRFTEGVMWDATFQTLLGD